MPMHYLHMRAFVSNLLTTHTEVSRPETSPTHVHDTATYHFRKLLELSLNNEPRTIDNLKFVGHAYWYAIYQTLDALRVSDISTAAPSGDMFQIDEEDNM